MGKSKETKCIAREEGLGRKQYQLDIKQPQIYQNRLYCLHRYVKIKGREQDPESANPETQLY